MSDDTPTVEKPAESAQPAPAGKPSALPEDEITRLNDEIVIALKTVYDPEIPADIYEIGLIYRIDIADGSGKGRCQRGLGPALGPGPDVGRGARCPQHVVSYLFIPKPTLQAKFSLDSKLARRRRRHLDQIKSKHLEIMCPLLRTGTSPGVLTTNGRRREGFYVLSRSEDIDLK